MFLSQKHSKDIVKRVRVTLVVLEALGAVSPVVQALVLFLAFLIRFNDVWVCDVFTGVCVCVCVCVCVSVCVS